MNNTLAKIEISQLPENTSNARELQWSMEFAERELQRAGQMRCKAWAMYDEAIDKGLCKAELDEFYMCAEMFDAIYSDAWAAWNKAQAAYLRLFS